MSLANVEWTDFYSNFSDYKIEDEYAVTIETLLKFYFNGFDLYALTLAKKE